MLKQTLLSLTLITAAMAQPPGAGAGPDFTDIKTYMNFTDAHLASIRQAGETARTANQTTRQQVAQKQTALNTLIANGSTDAAAIGRAMLEIAALRKTMDANLAKAREQALSFLSADQKTKLKALEDAEKLREEIGQAHALQLLAPPAGSGPRNFGENIASRRPLFR
jgi:Spy/CpxP family protein refolding chaperone